MRPPAPHDAVDQCWAGRQTSAGRPEAGRWPGTFNYRYSTLGFQTAANPDDGDLCPVSYAVKNRSPKVKKKIVEPVKGCDLLTGGSKRPHRPRHE